MILWVLSWELHRSDTFVVGGFCFIIRFVMVLRYILVLSLSFILCRNTTWIIFSFVVGVFCYNIALYFTNVFTTIQWPCFVIAKFRYYYYYVKSCSRKYYEMLRCRILIFIVSLSEVILCLKGKWMLQLPLICNQRVCINTLQGFWGVLKELFFYFRLHSYLLMRLLMKFSKASIKLAECILLAKELGCFLW